MASPACLERLEAPRDLERATVMTRAATYAVVLGLVGGFFWAYWEGYYRELIYPYNSFLYQPRVHFSDLSDFYTLVKLGAPYFGGAVYLPFSFVLMIPFAYLGGDAAQLLWFVLVAGGLGAYVSWGLNFLPRLDRVWAAIVLTVLTYPFLFAFDRGNIEAFVTLLFAAAVYAIASGRPDLAAVAIGTAGALKGDPLAFAVLFLVWGWWRQLAITAATAAVLTLVSASHYSLNVLHLLPLLRGDVSGYQNQYVIHDGGLAFGCSLFGALKLLIYGLGGGTHAISELLPFYSYSTAVLGLGVVVALWRLPLRLWEQVTLLLLAFDALPTVSGDYKLLHLLVPMILFLRSGSDERRRWAYLAGFVALMVPKAYAEIRPATAFYTGVNMGVVVDPLIMVAMALLIVESGLSRRHLPRAADAARALAAGV